MRISGSFGEYKGQGYGIKRALFTFFAHTPFVEFYFRPFGKV
jgi:hypothetical protein